MIFLQGESNIGPIMGKDRRDLKPGEEEATHLLSSGATLLRGISLVLGRDVDSDEIHKDPTLGALYLPTLSGAERYALLIMKKSLDPKENPDSSL